MASTLTKLLLVLALSSAALSLCPESEQIHCNTNDRCTRVRYICDGDNDCGDNSDETSELCQLWRNNDCERNYAQCTRHGSSSCVTIARYCEISDPPCEGDLDRRLCEMLRQERLIPIDQIEMGPGIGYNMDTENDLDLSIKTGEDLKEQIEHTIHHEECPRLYTRVGEECVSILFFGNMTWGESRQFCHSIDGELLTLDNDFNRFANLIVHLQKHNITADFWVGGMLQNETDGWQWVNNDGPIMLGSPYWAVRQSQTCQQRTVHLGHNSTRVVNEGLCYYTAQAPASPPEGHCISLTYANYFYMSDESCMSRRSPMCVLTKA